MLVVPAGASEGAEELYYEGHQNVGTGTGRPDTRSSPQRWTRGAQLDGKTTDRPINTNERGGTSLRLRDGVFSSETGNVSGMGEEGRRSRDGYPSSPSPDEPARGPSTGTRPKMGTP